MLIDPGKPLVARAVQVPRRTLDDIALSPLGFARELGTTLNRFEGGDLSAEDTSVRLRRLGFKPGQVADVLAARTKRRLRLIGEGS